MIPTSRDAASSSTVDPNVMRQKDDVKINISPPQPPAPPPPPPPPAGPPPPNLPRVDLLVGSREDYIRIGVPLYEASISGDWQAAKTILEERQELVRFGITDNNETALHIAASVEDTKPMVQFVQNLVNMMETRDLELQTKNYNTALCLAAAAGRVKTAKILVEKNSALPEIPGGGGMMPLYVAALFGNHDMVTYLYECSHKMTGDFWNDQNRGWVVQKCVEADIFDVALKIVIDRPELATKMDLLHNVLLAFASKPDVFNKYSSKNLGHVARDGYGLQLLRIIWGKIKILPKRDIDEIMRGPAIAPGQYPSRIMFVAAKMGNTRFLVELIRAYPDLLWKVNDKGLTIFHVAVKCRHQDIYNLLYEIGPMKDLITPLKDKDGNNMLHLVGKSSGKGGSRGASLLMQRELLWYKEVEKMIPLTYRKRRNKDNKTPYELFSERNGRLVAQSLDWMKDCMVVATLIVTVAFAVAFTIPGGYNQVSGIPLLIHERTFIVFVIADAISLVTSAASLLVFLSIITSGHDERDFLDVLPRKLILGLATLFISVTSMMVTFGASFFVLYCNGLKWVPILISAISAMPVVLFAFMQFPMFIDMFRSVYDARYLFKPKKRMLYNRDQKYKLL